MSRFQLKTAYFVVTTEGKITKLNPVILGLFGVLFLAVVIAISNRCYTFNRQLVSQRMEIHSQLLRMNSDQYRRGGALGVCEGKKNQICRQLSFNAGPELTNRTGNVDEN